MDVGLSIKNRDDFEVAIICALKDEAIAVRALFDPEPESSGDAWKISKAQGDYNAYSFGRIAGHDVVLVYLAGMGKVSAATAASHLSKSFGRIRLGLLIGVCGVVPVTDAGEQIYLGDVIVSQGIKQFDFGRHHPHHFVPKDRISDVFGRPSFEIRAFLNKMQVELHQRPYAVELYARQICQQPGMEAFQPPQRDRDHLFETRYRHKHQIASDCVQAICGSCVHRRDPVCTDAIEMSCEKLGCDVAHLVQRRRRDHLSVVHFGIIASGDRVMRSAEDRNEIADAESVIAFEMEGAGVWDSTQTIVIKGASDYADTHKSKLWQRYAAVTAAACARVFLEQWATVEKGMPGVLSDIKTEVGFTASEQSSRNIHNETESTLLQPQIAGDRPDDQPKSFKSITIGSRFVLSFIRFLWHTLLIFLGFIFFTWSLVQLWKWLFTLPNESIGQNHPLSTTKLNEVLSELDEHIAEQVHHTLDPAVSPTKASISPSVEALTTIQPELVQHSVNSTIGQQFMFEKSVNVLVGLVKYAWLTCGHCTFLTGFVGFEDRPRWRHLALILGPFLFHPGFFCVGRTCFDKADLRADFSLGWRYLVPFWLWRLSTPLFLTISKQRVLHAALLIFMWDGTWGPGWLLDDSAFDPWVMTIRGFIGASTVVSLWLLPQVDLKSGERSRSRLELLLAFHNAIWSYILYSSKATNTWLLSVAAHVRK